MLRASRLSKMYSRFDVGLSMWPFHAALALLQIPAFFLYFQSDPNVPFFYALCLSCLLCLCCLYKATGFLGPLFFTTLYLQPYLLVYYHTIYAGVLLTLLYWTLIQITHPFPEASLDRLVLFLLACLGSRLCSPAIHDHCAILALTTMTVSLTEGLVGFREWFGGTIEAIATRGWYRRRLLAKIRVLMIAVLVAVLLRTSVIPPQDFSSSHTFRRNKDRNTTIEQQIRMVLTAREIIALLITLLIAIHLVVREIGLLGGFRLDGIKVTINGVQPSSSKVSTKPPDSLRTTDDAITQVLSGRQSLRQLEKMCKNSVERVKLRNEYLKRRLSCSFDFEKLCGGEQRLELENFYNLVEGTCCENVVGIVTIPLGFVGPLKINDRDYFVPMATTEGALVASTARGCKLLSSVPGGVKAYVINDQMTRGPVFETSSLDTSVYVRNYIESAAGYKRIKQHFESTSRFARLCGVHTVIGPATRVFVRFSASTGDAMGMNMLSKATEKAVQHILEEMKKSLGKGQFVKLIALSGNFCVDKKSSSSNWLNGRGKSVVAEARIPEDAIRQQLKLSNPDDLVRINVNKNLLGTAMSASQPGASCNAQAANVVAAIFAACGQDLGQIGTSSSCLTWIEKGCDGTVHVSVTMPCIEVGTIGGGTKLPSQQACLELLGVQGSAIEEPGRNAKTLACVIAGTVMAAELSLLAALCTNDLVKAHMVLNRGAHKPL